MSLGQRRMDQLFVTHVYSTPGQSPMYWNHPVSVSYDTKREMWTIANDDAEPMPEGIVFNVRIEPSAQVVKGANWKSFSNAWRRRKRRRSSLNASLTAKCALPQALGTARR